MPVISLPVILLSLSLLHPADSATVAFIQDATPLIDERFRDFARLLTVSDECIPTAGNDFEIFRSGERYRELIFEDFRNARELIEIETFLLAEEPGGLETRDILCERAADGVEVHYLHESFGNLMDCIFDGRPLMTGFYDGFRKAGIKVYERTPIWEIFSVLANPATINHRKINIIDGKIAYTGGMNFTKGSLLDWEDAHMRITGPAVNSLSAILRRNWDAVCTRPGDKMDFRLEVSAAAPSESPGKIIQIVPDGLDAPAYMAEEAIIHLLQNARDYVWFETPYIFPTQRVLKALTGAAERGVDVRVLIPMVTDLGPVEPAFHTCFKECTRAGVKMYMRKPPFNHAKTIVSDDYLTCIASTNIDRLSFRRTYEANAYIYDAPTAIGQKEAFLEALEGSTPIDQKLFDSWTTGEYVLQFLTSLLGPWL
ncbi:MAG: phosphatidylserine/phosphatidylglycerophosphate/cardiolipin synthase family protein [Bacteroidales bacterium]|nr:phosphatidylserine/phosphatidylglycerophosphate/cardiolipin synthase family protein [Bacteroidales bacterium]